MCCGLLIACSSPTRPLVLTPQTATQPSVPPGVPGATVQAGVQLTVPVATQMSDESATVIVPEATQPSVPTVPVAQTNVVVPTIEVVAPPTGQAAWQALKQDFEPFEPSRVYLLPSAQMLWWYDPVTAQFVPLGWINTPVEASGQFRVRWQGAEAFLIPYNINGSYGLQLDSSIIERIRRAGYTEDTIETFLYRAPDIVPQS